ncbi:MAG: potassium channel family protein [Dehalococcoidia bacterium]
MRVLVMGCGKVGVLVAQSLAQEGHNVTVIDEGPELLTSLPSDTSVEAIVADGTSEADLRKAGIEVVEAFIAASESDNANAMAAQTARHLFHVPNVICIVGDPVRYEMYRQMGLEAVCPTLVVLDMVLNELGA